MKLKVGDLLIRNDHSLSATIAAYAMLVVKIHKEPASYFRSKNYYIDALAFWYMPGKYVKPKMLFDMSLIYLEKAYRLSE